MTAADLGVVEIRTPATSVVEIPTPISTLFDITGPIFNPAVTAYLHKQLAPGAVWVVEHHLGYDPGGITVIDDEGYRIEGYGVQYVVPGSRLLIVHDISIMGTAHLS